MTALHAPIDKEIRETLSAYDDLFASLLVRRGITTAKEAAAFLNPSYDAHLHDPMQMKNMPAAAARLARALEKGEYIAVWSDYDADGIPGGVILHDFLKKAQAHFTNYIPHRALEGYGVNTDGVEKLARAGVTLLITVDSGITDNAALAYAKERGIDVIVTDHHEPSDTLPDVFAVIDPKQEGETYPFRDLCGAALAWKLVCATLTHPFPTRKNFTEGWEKWLLDMAGFATISDMVPLLGENRVLAKYGLLVMRKARRLGLAALCRVARVSPRTLSEDDVGYVLAPRVNAASRMGDPLDAFHLFTTTDESEAQELAKKLEAANRRRRAASAAITRAVHARVRDRGDRENLPPVLVLGDPTWSPSLLGLVASTVAEEYGRPVFLWGREKFEEIKGSCRSDGSTNVLELMNSARDVFLHYGGHTVSGGFTLDPRAVSALEEKLVGAFCTLARETRDPVLLRADAELTLSRVNHALLAHLDQLAPFGEGNAKPLWLFRNVILQKVLWFGKNEEHVRLIVADAGVSHNAVAFFAKHSLRKKVRDLSLPARVTLLAHVERDTFLYKNALRLRVVLLA